MNLMLGKETSFWLKKKRLRYNISGDLVKLSLSLSAFTAVFHPVIGSMGVEDQKRFASWKASSIH